MSGAAEEAATAAGAGADDAASAAVLEHSMSIPSMLFSVASWYFYVQGCIILPHVWGLYFDLDLENGYVLQ